MNDYGHHLLYLLHLDIRSQLHMGRGKQARVQEFAGGGAQNLKAFFFFFFFAFHFFRGGGPAQKLAEKNTFSTKKVAKYR